MGCCSGRSRPAAPATSGWPTQRRQPAARRPRRRCCCRRVQPRRRRRRPWAAAARRRRRCMTGGWAAVGTCRAAGRPAAANTRRWRYPQAATQTAGKVGIQQHWKYLHCSVSPIGECQCHWSGLLRPLCVTKQSCANDADAGVCNGGLQSHACGTCHQNPSVHGAGEKGSKLQYMTWRRRAAVTASLWPYIVPLATVYAAEYAMQVGFEIAP